MGLRSALLGALALPLCDAYALPGGTGASQLLRATSPQMMPIGVPKVRNAPARRLSPCQERIQCAQLF